MFSLSRRRVPSVAHIRGSEGCPGDLPRLYPDGYLVSALQRVPSMSLLRHMLHQTAPVYLR